ncbi:MAG: pyridoxal phosphate-dependent aminotransferase [Spirochaetaceae bacterium]|nr:MAG: pyridoxal phosphate-dependent aminotransferase [Spirochaetaceae bacterium]
MSYDFDQVIERRGSGAVKWDLARGDTLPMWVADMDFAAAPEVVNALRERLLHPVFGYTLVSDSYRRAFCDWQQQRNRLQLDPDWMLATPGVMPAVRAAIDALSQPGDSVVVQTPVYHPFFDAVRAAGRRLRINALRQTDLRYRMDLDQLETLFRSGARLLLMSSPHNPVARVWSETELQQVCRLARRWDVTIISDEIHSDIVFSGARFVSLLSLAPERSVACFSVSKSFNLAGIGASQTVVPDETLRSRLSASLKRSGLSSIENTLSLVAAEAAYRHGAPWLDALLQYLQGNLELLRALLAQRLPGVRLTPQQGCYIAWLDFGALQRDRGLSDAQLKRLLLQRARVWLSPGVQFGRGGAGFQRLNFATPRSLLRQGIERIGDALASD